MEVEGIEHTEEIHWLTGSSEIRQKEGHTGCDC